MVPACSHKVPRVSCYSGYCLVISPFVYGTFTLFGRSFQGRSTRLDESIMQSEPRSACPSVWALPRSLAATYGIVITFSSSGYLDVSVHRVPPVHLWIQCTVPEVCSGGLPHSEIRGSKVACTSPRLFAACHVFHRLPEPRHPPYALLCFRRSG